MKKVVVVGAGFGGLWATRALARDPRIQVTVIDKKNHHLFQPLLYQVATAGLSPADIATPIRAILAGYPNVEVYLDEVTGIDPIAKTVTRTNGVENYDALVLACGATHSYFNHPEWEKYAPGLKTLDHATEIRQNILEAFEIAEKTFDSELQKAYLTFIVVGGGPTGVELAGSIAELAKFTLARDFRHVDLSKTKIVLVEAGPRVLAAFDPALSEKAKRALEELGVHVELNARVTNVTAEAAYLGDRVIPSRTIVWAAGVQASALGKLLPAEVDRAGRVPVGDDLSLAGHPEIFAIGDMALFKDHKHGELPGLAPVAMQQGECAARNIIGDLDQKPRATFRYFDKGTMATIGRKKAVLQMKGLKMSGFFAWLGWIFVHLLFLIGFRNRLLVLLQLAWSYFTFKRGARLIVREK